MNVKGFCGEYRWLSNFYKSPVTLWGVKFDTVEQAYQASKCSNISDWNMMINCKTPGDAKRKGRLITMRPDFDDIKLDVMYHLLVLKFSDPYFKNKLIRIKIITLRKRTGGAIHIGEFVTVSGKITSVS